MSKVTHVLSASSRQILGTKVKSLRKSGLIPANIYGKGIASQAVQVTEKDLNKVFEAAGESSLVSVTIDEKDTFPVIFKNPFYNPISGLLAHLDMYKVNLKEKISAMVPIVLVGEAPAVKAGARLVKVMHELEVSADAAHLPHEIEIDITVLENDGDQIHVRYIKLPSGVTSDVDGDEVIVLTQIAEEEPEETPTLDIASIEVEKKGKSEEEAEA